MQKKYESLLARLEEVTSVAVAFSGGVDSALVLRAAYDALGKNAVGLTGDGPAVAREELAVAIRVAEHIGARHVVLPTWEINDQRYAANPQNRCYFCKNNLYTVLREFCARDGIARIANGTNLDDLGDFRPGLDAAAEFEVLSPLRDAGFTKQDVRAVARYVGLEVWEKPAAPCLASRIPYGSPVTKEKLAQIELAELLLHILGVRSVRVRHFGRTARIDVAVHEREIIERAMPAIRPRFNRWGFDVVELAELRSGSLNAVVRKQ